MITIKHRLKNSSIDTNNVRNLVSRILTHLDYADFDIGIWFTTPTTIQKYNAQYREKNKPTDILSFAYHEHLKPGKRIVVKSPEDKNLGDLIICPEYIKQHPEKYTCTFDDRITELIIHGICHLLGYDHEKDSDYTIMKRKELEIIKVIKN